MENEKGRRKMEGEKIIGIYVDRASEYVEVKFENHIENYSNEEDKIIIFERDERDLDEIFEERDEIEDQIRLSFKNPLELAVKETLWYYLLNDIYDETEDLKENVKLQWERKGEIIGIVTERVKECLANLPEGDGMDIDDLIKEEIEREIY